MGYFFTDPTDTALINHLLYHGQDAMESVITIVSAIIQE
jgi:hypothetical protein